MILVVDMLLSAFYADSFGDAVKFTVVFLNMILIAVWFTQMSGWQFTYYKWLKIGCLFHLCFTFFSVIFTEQALEITEKFLIDEMQQSTILWIQMHLYAGISGQTGTNAFFFSVLIGLFLAELCTKCSHRFLVSILFFSSWLGLLLTGKKGLMIAAILASLAVYWAAGNSFQKKAVLLLANMGVISLLVAVVLFRDKIYQMFYVSVLSRLRIMDGMLNAIRQKPVLGNGVNSVANFTYERRLGHNIYLQMWVEQGIIGLAILLAALFFILYTTYIRMKKSKVLNCKSQTYFFSFFIQIFTIVYGFFGNPIYDYNFVITYYLSIAAGFASDD